MEYTQKLWNIATTTLKTYDPTKPDMSTHKTPVLNEENIYDNLVTAR